MPVVNSTVGMGASFGSEIVHRASMLAIAKSIVVSAKCSPIRRLVSTLESGVGKAAYQGTPVFQNRRPTG